MFNLDSYGKLASFDVYPTSILGDVYKTVKVLAVIDYDTARMYVDVNNLAVSVYPTLPAATPKDYKKYKYVKVQHLDGTIGCVALEWINQDTVVFHSDVVVNVKVKLKNIGTVDVIRKLLIANNLEPIEITVE